MASNKCDVCGKTFTADTESEQFVLCDDCKNAMHSDIEEVGDENA